MAQPSSSDDSLNALIAALIAQYIRAEQDILNGVSGILSLQGLDKLAALSRLRRLARDAVARMEQANGQYVAPIARAAIEAGRSTAEKALAGLPPQPPTGRGVALFSGPFDFSIPHGVRSVQAIRADLLSPLEDVERRITRLPDDIYKVISPPAAAGQVLGRGYTPAQAQAYAWRQYIRQGVTGFTDRSGRNWSLSAYVEMSVRTAAMRAYNDSHLQVMQAANIHLFTVSDDGHPCPLCLPWQNRVVADHEDGIHPTMADAITAGLLHPNCRHIWIPVIPGFTRLPEPQQWTPERQAAYDATQKQRNLELQIRKAKATLEYATTPEARADGRADVRAAQQRLRDFLAQHPDLLRRTRREQLNLANGTVKLPI